MPTARRRLFTLRIQDETPIREGKKNRPSIHSESHLTTILSQFVMQQYSHGQYLTPFHPHGLTKARTLHSCRAPTVQYIGEALCVNRKTVLFELCRTPRTPQLRFIDGTEKLACGWIVSERHRISFGSEEAGTCVCEAALANNCRHY